MDGVEKKEEEEELAKGHPLQRMQMQTHLIKLKSINDLDATTTPKSIHGLQVS